MLSSLRSHRNVLGSSQPTPTTNNNNNNNNKQQQQQPVPSLDTDYDLVGNSDSKHESSRVFSFTSSEKAGTETKTPSSGRPLFNRRPSRRVVRGSRPSHRAGHRTSTVLASLPPPLATTPTYDHTFRYKVNMTGSYLISGTNLALAFGAVCTISNSTLVSLVSSFKVRRVTIWPSSQNTADTADIYWYGPISNTIKDNAKIRTLPTSVTVTAPVASRPPRGSHAGDWIQTNLMLTTDLFGVTVTAGSVIDVHCVCTLSNTLGASSATVGVASAALGNVYYMPLDGNTSNNLLAVGVTSTH